MICTLAQSLGVPNRHQSNPSGGWRGRGSGVETWCMSGWQLTRHGTLAHDDGARESSHEVSLGDWVGQAGIWVDECGWGWTQSFSSGQLVAALWATPGAIPFCFHEPLAWTQRRWTPGSGLLCGEALKREERGRASWILKQRLVGLCVPSFLHSTHCKSYTIAPCLKRRAIQVGKPWCCRTQ